VTTLRRAFLALALMSAFAALAAERLPEHVRSRLTSAWREAPVAVIDGEATASRRAKVLRRPRKRGAASTVVRTTPHTYFGRIVAQRDSVLDRWPSRVDRPVRVWIAAGETSEGWRPTFLVQLVEAFDDWEETGIPVHFTFVNDSADAEVRVRWADTLSGRASGRTTWRADANRWMLGADVWIAMRASDGALQDDRGVRAIALHEIGHLLGLAHSGGREDIMAAWVAADTLSDADRATVRLLYALPAGRVGTSTGD
jgi:hypothetical protein